MTEQLENAITPPERRKTDSHIWFEVPRTTINFVGREKELKELKQLYKSHKFLLVVTTTGMGGVGKSELVKNFAKEIAGMIFFKSSNALDLYLYIHILIRLKVM